MEKKYVVDGFEFSTESDYKMAKEELEAIIYFKDKINLSDLSNIAKLYNRILDRRTFHTPVGYSFLKDLQNRLIQSGYVKNEDVEKIFITNRNHTENQVDSLSIDHFKKIATVEKSKRRNLKIINTFLVVTILIMFLIALYSDKTVFTKFENELIDRYATWEEELNNRELELEEKEKELNNKLEELESQPILNDSENH